MMKPTRLIRQRLKPKSDKLKQNYKRSVKDQFLICKYISQQVNLFIFIINCVIICIILYQLIFYRRVNVRTVLKMRNKKLTSSVFCFRTVRSRNLQNWILFQKKNRFSGPEWIYVHRYETSRIRTIIYGD